MMSSFQVVDSSPGSSVSVMETSNFAHVIFQNVGKSFLPQAPLECCYTLTPYITPHPKDWVGIFKVGWSTARDYYTFLWSPTPENYEPGSTVHRTVVFQGYYVPKSDGEFYQFCYVTHGGDIRGASTPFMFRSSTPTEEELLTVTEDESNSDILVVTTKTTTGLMERAEEEEAQRHERRELLVTVRLLQAEKKQLQEEQRRLTREREQERETCTLLRTHNQELLRSSQGLSEEREEARRRLTEATDRLRQLEEDLLGVTQRGLQKETELDRLRDRLKALMAERDILESHVKNEKDERDLYKAHLRSTEQENTKLSAELQMLKAVELNREVTIAQFQEEMDRLRGCVVQRDSLEKELLHYKKDKAELARVREQLRQTDGELQASRQQASLLAAELREAAGARDRGVAELYRARLEADRLRTGLADAQDECRRMEGRLERVRSASAAATHKEAAVGTSGDSEGAGEVVVSEAEAELQREVEELKLRLHMAAEHYKEKYRECQRLRRQVAKLSGSSETTQESKRNAATETMQETMIPSPESPTEENISGTVLRGRATITPLLLGFGEPEPAHAVAQIDTPCPDAQCDTIPAGARRTDQRVGATEEEEEEEEEEERQGEGDEGDDKEGAEGEGASGREEEEGRDSPLRMTSWVEVENERRSAEENEEEEEEEEEEESSGEEEEEEEEEEEDEEEEEGGSTAETEAAVEEGRSEEEEEVEEEEEEVEQTTTTTCWVVEEELAQMEEKWREQCAINETLKRRLADEEERFRVQMAERASEVTELKRNLAQALQDKQHLQEELQRYVCRQREAAGLPHGAEAQQQTVVLRYPLPYPQDPSPPPLVPHRPAELQYGNPYSGDDTRDGGDGALSPDQTSRPPPEAPSSCAQPCAPPINPLPSPPEGAGAPPGAAAGAWDPRGVVRIQPSRSMSPPDGLEHPPDEPSPPTVVDAVAVAAQPPCDHHLSTRRPDARRSFCFDSSNDVHRRCPLCEVIFPPHFEQRSFEQHVESHWKVCPVCSEQFPLNCQQQLFERHVLTHFDGHVLNFEQIE